MTAQTDSRKRDRKPDGPTDARCPIAPPPSDPASCFQRIRLAAIAYAIDVQDIAPQLTAQLQADDAALYGVDPEGERPPRLDLALGALRVAAKTDQLDVATCFAQVAIDFLTGDYDPENFDLEDDDGR